jgi:antitoxin component YwqK of YwqJK toxin-antitoxin module
MKKLFIILMVLISACSSSKLDFSKLIDKNGIVYENGDDKPYSGEVVCKFTNGKNNFEGNYENGIKAKNWVYYFENGQKKSEGTYKDGAKEGTWTYWDEKGTKIGDEIYKDNKLLSKAIEINSDSLKQKTDTTVAEVKEIEKAKAPVNAKKQSSGIVKFDQLRGGPVKTLNGIIYTGPVVDYHSNGVKSLEGNFRNGKRNGLWVFYDKKGKVKSSKVYK